MSAPIFYISAEEYETLTPGASFELDGPEGKHALVKRMEVGESIDLGDGTGRRAVGTVHSLTDRGVIVRVEQLREEHTSPRIYLVQALAKDGRDLLAIETATELGVYGVLPWSADRSIVRWKGERAAKAHTKWQNTVTAAAKQSRRALIPEVYDLYSTTDLVELIEEVTGQGSAVFILHEQATERLSTQAAKLAGGENLPEEIYLLVGPEGGISDREVQLFTEAGAHLALLGDEVLRSSTAGSAAMCTLNVVLDRW
ncbi:16S rRNA (uracil(1498)-N(3))-methyltransferase [Rothia sp. HMSC066H02]|uniref:16S rRNA (uracil(1498)-N(3))-methyltransferase n=1 Tax=unclassified Rothia (in: high G+C Gram-positive bacteria) TaxID=2689056 RepID=UPI0008A45FC5|nr:MULTISPECIES: 16S rRNA (uracil(1498)-N(3))-methyltransferase [unclassified Rothia (in: high G+C Gram-positive bacteria)]OFO97181.1 16S rRNA (uracil(1498)-N(3))-methyltransferase [Rothia sp. HMSC065D09]OFP11743.1 16S rRNA (uracil(1498)-N(3))-methyltransferase [Rothia sp. HMSC066H02]